MTNVSVVMVVGSRGFLGSALRSALVAHGVSIVEVTSQRPMQSLSAPKIAVADAVIWAASGVTPAVAAANPALADAELAYFAESVRHIQRVAGAPRIVLASSGGTVYDEAFPPPYAESSPTAGGSPYAAMKLAMEEITSAAGGTSARISNLYGVGQPARRGLGVISYWLRAAAAGEPVRLLGDSSASRDYVEVGDAAEAIAQIATTSKTLPAHLNVGSGTATSLEELLSLVEIVVASPLRVERIEAGRSFDRLVSWLDVSRIEEALGWKSTTPLPEGLKKVWESLRGS